MVLETTWHTPTGWLLVHDLLVVEPTSDEARRPDYRRAPGDHAAAGTLLRLATCLEGKVEVVAQRRPRLRVRLADGDLGLRGRRLQHHDRQPPGWRSELHLVVHRPPGLGGRPLLRPHHLGQGRVRLRLVVLGKPSAREHRRGPEPTRRNRGLLAGVAGQRHLPRPSVAQLHRAQRADAQGPELCAHRRHHGGGDDVAARDPGGARNWDYRYTWIRDSSFMLRSLYRLGFDWEALEYFAFVLEAVGGARQRLRPADHVRHRRSKGPDRADPRPPVGLAELEARAGGQRGLGSAPERRVGDDPRRRGHPPPHGGGPDRPSGVGGRRQIRRRRHCARRRPRPGHLGDQGRPRALHCLQGPVLGGHGPGRRPGP